MDKIVTVIEHRPHYYRGQLLLEDDFLAEQNYHVNARRRHDLNLHGWGIVHGLSISRESAKTIAINPGFAIDEAGYEIFVDATKQVNLAEFGSNELLRVSLAYEETTGSDSGAAGQQKRRACCALITVSKAAGSGAGLTLATLQLDGQGNLSNIDESERRYVRVLAPGSITAADLHESLKKGWLKLPFRAVPLVNPPEGETGIPPAFRVGETEALSPDHEDANEKDRGAAGTMAIPIPPNVTQVTRLRIAGKTNEGEIFLKLFKGGWDPVKMKHVKESLVDQKIVSSTPFLQNFDIHDTAFDLEYHTLSLWLRGTRRTAISLIAIELVYY
jgi:hypothetical protein